MKTLNIKSSIIIFAAIALTGCAKTDELQRNPDDALAITSVSGISSYAQLTKSVIEGSSLPIDEASGKGIGVFVTATDGSAYDGHDRGYTNVNYKYAVSGWTTQTPVYLSNNEGLLLGYFPYNSQANNLKSVPVESSLGVTDYLYATQGNVSRNKKSVSIQMNHALARIHLTLKKDATKYKAAGLLTNIKFENSSIAQRGNMDVSDGSLTASNPGTSSFAVNEIITETGITKDILLVYSTASGKLDEIKISLTVDGTSASVVLTDNNGIVAQGSQYNATLVLGDTGISVSGAGVSIWTEGGAKEVDTDGHKVTVKLADESAQPGIVQDMLLSPVSSENGRVTVVAASKSGKRPTCFIEGSASVKTEQSGSFYTFTISEVASDVTATIEWPRIQKITFPNESESVQEKRNITLAPKILPDDAFDKSLVWSSGDETIATVDKDGNVTGVKVGETTITATAVYGGVQGSCKVVVPVTHVTKVELNLKDKDIIPGREITLIPTVFPDNATDKSVTWSSDRESVATVDANGKVKGIALGDATITAASKDGYKCGNCIIHVVENNLTLIPQWDQSMGLTYGTTGIITANNPSGGKLELTYSTGEYLPIYYCGTDSLKVVPQTSGTTTINVKSVGSDGSRVDASVTVTVVKAIAYIKASDRIFLYENGPGKDVNILSDHDVEFYIENEDPDKISAVLNGNTVSITPLKPGRGHVEYHTIENDRYKPYPYGDKGVTVNVYPYPDAVDMGLSVKWASCNLGAAKESDYGNHFPWGHTEGAEGIEWKLKLFDFRLYNCPYHNGDNELSGWTKYCTSDWPAYWAGEGEPDNLTVLQPEDDASTVKLGNGWRTPTEAEWQELIDNCSWTWTQSSGVNGYRVTSRKSGYENKSIFLPASGYCPGNILYDDDNTHGYYWSSTLHYQPYRARRLDLTPSSHGTIPNARYQGLTIRPVKN